MPTACLPQSQTSPPQGPSSQTDAAGKWRRPRARARGRRDEEVPVSRTRSDWHEPAHVPALGLVEWRPSPSRKSPHSTTTSLAFALSPVAPAPEPGRRFTRRRRRRSGRLRAAAPSTEECLLLLPPSSTTVVGDHPHSPHLRLPTQPRVSLRGSALSPVVGRRFPCRPVPCARRYRDRGGEAMLAMWG